MTMTTAVMTRDPRDSATRRYGSGVEFARRIGVTWNVAMRFLKRAEANGALVACRLPGCRPLWDLEAALKMAAECGAFVPESAESGR
jgi:hypothetical protein